MTIRVQLPEMLVRRRRAGIGILLAGLFSMAAPVAAQDTVTQGPPDENGTIGPRELQRFELPGTRTNPAYQTPETPRERPRVQEPPTEVVSEAPAPAPEAQPEAAAEAPAETQPTTRATPPPQPANARRPSTETRDTPRVEQDEDRSPAPSASARPSVRSPVVQLPAPVMPVPPPPSGKPATESTGFSWAYLLFVLLGFLLAIGTMQLLRMRQPAQSARKARVRARPQIPAAEPVQPAPAPTAAKLPPINAPRPSFDNVSTSDVVAVQIRPWLQLEFKPDRAAATLTEAAVQYELAISNVGNAVARNVRVEARMFNAGAEQEKEIKAFFAAPVNGNQGAQVLAIPPRKGARLRNVVAMPKEHVREINVQGRRLFIPLVAFNVVYEWGEGKSGQTSMSYLVGREPDTPSDRMGAFRLDLGPRVYRSVAQRPSEVAMQV